MARNKVVTIITAITGDRVIIGDNELQHSIESHYPYLPKDMFLELIERILKDPTEIYLEKSKHCYHLFYKINSSKFVVVVVKKLDSGNYFSTMYPTGNQIRNKHKKLKKVNI